MDLKIQGVPVHFPYKPYGCQLSMLNRVISALNSKQGCLIESPTGTGKTLALLCASLGWLEHQMGKNYGEGKGAFILFDLTSLIQMRSVVPKAAKFLHQTTQRTVSSLVFY